MKKKRKQHLEKVPNSSSNIDSPTSSVQHSIEAVQFMSGPLPPASAFADYEATFPGAADRILAFAESEQKFRHGFLEKQEDHSFFITRRGQTFGFILSSTILAMSAVFLILGLKVEGFVSLAVGIIPQLIHGWSKTAKKEETKK